MRRTSEASASSSSTATDAQSSAKTYLFTGEDSKSVLAHLLSRRVSEDSLKSTNCGDCNIFHYACAFQRWGVVRELLRRKPELLHSKNSRGESAKSFLSDQGCQKLDEIATELGLMIEQQQAAAVSGGTQRVAAAVLVERSSMVVATSTLASRSSAAPVVLSSGAYASDVKCDVDDNVLQRAMSAGYRPFSAFHGI
jgi:ankyrin repeat protein